MKYEVHCYGLKELQWELERAGDVPPEVRKEMVKASADITEKALIYFAATMLSVDPGTYYRGDVARSVKRQPPRATKTGATCIIKFEGESHGNRNAEIAFVNHFGTSKQHARPFITRAEKESGDPGAKAAAEILHEWLKQNKL